MSDCRLTIDDYKMRETSIPFYALPCEKKIVGLIFRKKYSLCYSEK